MLGFLVRRLLYMIPTVLVMSIVTFTSSSCRRATIWIRWPQS